MNSNISSIELNTSKPNLTLYGLGIGLLIAILYTALYSLILINVENVPIAGAIVGTAISTIIKFFLLVVSWYLVLRLMYEYSGWSTFGAHLVTGILFSVIWYYSYLWIFDFLFGVELLKGGGFLQNKAWVMFSAFLEYAIIFSIIHVIDSINRLKAKEKQAAELRELSNRQQIANLKAQLNPHFLFNTLNSINSMVAKDVDETRKMISELSDMLRYSLRSFEQQRVRLADEIEFVKKYLRLEKHRLGEKLEYTIKIPEKLGEVEIPPMIIQPLVENSVKHGIIPTTDGGAVTIAVNRTGGDMIVEVEDTGQGFPEDVFGTSDGIGIRNTNKHLKKRYGERSALHFESVDSSGTKVWFKIPLN